METIVHSATVESFNGVSSFEAEQDEIMATQNFASVQEIAQNFAEKLKNALVVDIVAQVFGALL